MNRIVQLTLTCFLLSGSLFAQKGLGINSPNPQAALHIVSPDKGVLLPQISLMTSTTFLGGATATASHTGMLVYNTNTATNTGLLGEGYYFWNSSHWEKVIGDTDLFTDLDGDTQIQVEETGDDDTIRFDTAGRERLVIANSGNIGINVPNPTNLFQIDIPSSVVHPVVNHSITSITNGVWTTVIADVTVLNNLSLVALSFDPYVFGSPPTQNFADPNLTTQGIVVADATILRDNLATSYWFYGLDSPYVKAALVEFRINGAALEVLVDQVRFITASGVAPADQNNAYFTGPGWSSSVYRLDLVRVSTQDNPSLGNVLTARSSGRVGIGTDAPTQTLTVSGTAQITGSLYDSSGDAGTAGQVLSAIASGTNWIDASLAGGSGTDSQTLSYGSSATTTQTTLEITNGNSLTLTASGSLSFNQTATNTLELIGNSDASQLIDTDGDTQIQVEEGSGDNTIRFDAAGVEIATLTSTQTLFNTATTLDDTLTVSGNATLTADLYVGANSTASGTLTANSTTTLKAALVDASGDVGTTGQVLSTTGTSTNWITISTDSIADADGDTQIQVEEGSGDNTIRFDTNGTERMSINPVGAVTITGNASNTNPPLVIQDSEAYNFFDLNSTNNDPNNYPNRASFRVQNQNQAIHFLVDGRSNNRRAAIQVGHDFSAFSSNIGVLSINPLGGVVGINTLSPTRTFDVAGDVRVRDAFYDSSNQSGSAGQILSSTATGTDWVDSFAPAAGITTDSTLRWNGTTWVENTGLQSDGSTTTSLTTELIVANNATVTGTLEVTGNTTLTTDLYVGANTTASGTLTANSTTTLKAALVDGAGSPGTAGRVLTSTGTATLWAVNATLTDTDTDTKIQVEETGDEDTIRFDAEGVEVATFTVSQTTLFNDLSIIVPSQPATGTAQIILPNFETYSAANETLLNANYSFGAVVGRLFDGTPTAGGAGEHIQRNTGLGTGPGTDWGIRYSFGTDYYFTNLRLQARTDGNGLGRTGGGVFRIYNDGNLVYTSSVVASATAAAGFTPSIIPNIIGDRVEYVILNGGNSQQGDDFINAEEIQIVGQEIETAFFVDNSTRRVGIGTGAPTDTLTVSGTLSVLGAATFGSSISQTGTGVLHPDYVFEEYFEGGSEYNPSYRFTDLEEIESFLAANKHLPGVQSRAEIAKNRRWDLSENVRTNLEKIEELFLYTIEQEKELKAILESKVLLEEENNALKASLATILKRLEKLENK